MKVSISNLNLGVHVNPCYLINLLFQTKKYCKINMWKFLTLGLCKKFQMKCDEKYHFTAN